jgi:hypothetical protein
MIGKVIRLSGLSNLRKADIPLGHLSQQIPEGLSWIGVKHILGPRDRRELDG